MVTQQSLATSILVVKAEYLNKSRRCTATKASSGFQAGHPPDVLQALSLGFMRKRLSAMHNENEKLHRKIDQAHRPRQMGLDREPWHG